MEELEEFFKIGEEIEVTLTTGLTSTAGESLEESFVYRFRVESAGNGTFPNDSTLTLGNNPASVTAGDWGEDQDGDLDLAVATLALALS